MLTPKQIAERLQLSLSMIYKLLSTGELESYRIGSAYRVSEKQLSAYLKDAKHEPRNTNPILKGKTYF